jgi:predicted dehydrogenase
LIHYRGAFCPEWKGQREDGGSMLLMETCHVLDIFRWWSGDEVESVVGIGAPKVVPYYEFHDTDFTSFIFRSGIVGHVVTCHTRSANPEVWTDKVGYSEPYGHQYEFSITCTKGALHFKPLKGLLYIMEHDPPGGESFTQSLKRTEDLSHLSMHRLIHDTVTEVDNFIEAVLEGRDTNITPEDALNTHLVCYAGQEALDRGEKVRVQY